MVLALALLMSHTVSGQVVMNDHMFPPQAAAKPFSDFDAKGFLINGKRTFLVSAGIEYARVPHELWQDRLLRLKRAGFNSVEIYTLWNFHEPREGQFEFSGDQDLDQFLSLVKKLGMYAIVRVGPYYCAEWDHGGYPVWLRFKDGLRVREDNAAFEKYVDRFFDRLLPIVFKHQINKGGSVILVQLENEHPKGWGTIMPDNYFKHLQSKALNLGMQVPYLFSGVHHATDPAGEGLLDDVTRPNPWFSTEFWSMWYTQYGAKPADAAIYDRRTWKIIAHGGSGYNFYMAHGGSNFGYTNNDEDAASYDYGAAVGQAGDLRPLYYTFKRAGFFARSFEEILENSSDATKLYTQVSADTALKVTARKSNAGDLVFLDNPGKKTIRTGIHIAGQQLAVKLAPGEIYPLVHRYPVNPSVMLDWALSRVYGVVKQNKTTTILVEANAGEKLALHFSVKGKPVINPAEGVKISGNTLKIERIVRGGNPVEYFFRTGDQSVRVLVGDSTFMDKTWLTDLPAQGIITGVSYLGKSGLKQGKFTAEAEYPLTGKKDGLVKLYLEKGSKTLVSTFKTLAGKTPQVSLSAWENKNGAAPAMPGFDDQKWLYSESPLQMGADGDLTNAAWYRTKLDIPSSGKYSLQVDGGDRGTLFVDGKLLSRWKIRDGELSLNLEEGKHDLAIFTAHDGRDKMAAYLGPITDIDKKGLSGKVTLKKGGPFIDTLNHWYFTKAADLAALKQGAPVLDTLKAMKYKIGADAFELKQGFGWFQTIILAQEGLDQLMVLFKSVDENATVFINGQQMAHHEGWNIPFDLKISDPGMLKKPMVLSVFIENYDKEGGIDQAVKINRIGTGIPVKGWRMHGGPDVPGTWNANGHFDGPRFFRSSFSLSLTAGQIWRVNPEQMSHGSVWVNGHNLGRYPEKNGDIGLYIPEPWLKDGKNELVIYDEEGKTPDHITVRSEPAAGRVIYQLTGGY